MAIHKQFHRAIDYLEWSEVFSQLPRILAIEARAKYAFFSYCDSPVDAP